MYESLERYLYRFTNNLADRWRGTTKIEAKSLEAIAHKTNTEYVLSELCPQMELIIRALHFMGIQTRESATAIDEAKQARLNLIQKLGRSMTTRQFEEVFHIDRYDYSGIRVSNYYSRPYSRSEELGQHRGFIKRSLRNLH